MNDSRKRRKWPILGLLVGIAGCRALPPCFMLAGIGQRDLRTRVCYLSLLWNALMTLTRFVTKNAFRNKRRSALTVLSIAFSLLLLTLMITIWRAFYIDQGAPESAARLITPHRASLTIFLPRLYPDKTRRLPRGVGRAPITWIGAR